MTIKRVYLFTNRNTIFFDEFNEQILDLQKSISFSHISSWEETTIQDIIEKMMEDRPAIYIARWQEWCNSITLDEFSCLLGQGEWYYKKKLEINKNQQ